MKYLYFLVAIGAVLCAGCSDTEGPNVPSEPVYEPTATCIGIQHDEESGLVPGTFDGFYMAVIYNAEDACRFDTESYVSFEIYSGPELRFINEGSDAEGNLHLTEENTILLPVPTPPVIPPVSGLPIGYDYYQYLPVCSAGEGVYEFALKVYQPQNERYFITPRYRMKLEPLNHLMRVEIEPVI